MNSILIWLVTAVMGLGAVTTSTDSATSSSVEPAPADAAIEMAAPQPAETRQTSKSFANREMLPPCGTVDVTRGAQHQRLSSPRVAWTCLGDALGGRGAELITVDQRTRNLSVHTVYRARHDGQLEIWTQRSRTMPYRPLSAWRFELCAPGDDLGRQPCTS